MQRNIQKLIDKYAILITRIHQISSGSFHFLHSFPRELNTFRKKVFNYGLKVERKLKIVPGSSQFNAACFGERKSGSRYNASTILHLRTYRRSLIKEPFSIAKAEGRINIRTLPNFPLINHYLEKLKIFSMTFSDTRIKFAGMFIREHETFFGKASYKAKFDIAWLCRRLHP